MGIGPGSPGISKELLSHRQSELRTELEELKAEVEKHRKLAEAAEFALLGGVKESEWRPPFTPSPSLREAGKHPRRGRGWCYLQDTKR
jgi:hypothetical protein